MISLCVVVCVLYLQILKMVSIFLISLMYFNFLTWMNRYYDDLLNFLLYCTIYVEK